MIQKSDMIIGKLDRWQAVSNTRNAATIFMQFFMSECCMHRHTVTEQKNNESREDPASQ